MVARKQRRFMSLLTYILRRAVRYTEVSFAKFTQFLNCAEHRFAQTPSKRRIAVWPLVCLIAHNLQQFASQEQRRRNE